MVSFASSSYFAANRSLPFWRWGRFERLSSARLRLVTNKVSLSSSSSWNWTQIFVIRHSRKETGTTNTAFLQIPPKNTNQSILQPKERPRCVILFWVSLGQNIKHVYYCKSKSISCLFDLEGSSHWQSLNHRRSLAFQLNCCTHCIRWRIKQASCFQLFDAKDLQMW